VESYFIHLLSFKIIKDLYYLWTD